MIIKSTSTILLSLLFTLCFSCKTYEANELPGQQLYFGSGGGYAGSYDEYILVDNGQLFYQKGLKGSVASYGKVKKSAAKSLFKTWEEKKMGAADFKHPGNLYYFIGMRSESGDHKISWGDTNHKAKEDWKELHKSLMALTQDGDSNPKK